MNIALGSIFRNSTAYLERYWLQLEQLATQLGERGDTLHLVLAEGDSTDETWASLVYAFNKFTGLSEWQAMNSRTNSADTIRIETHEAPEFDMDSSETGPAVITAAMKAYNTASMITPPTNQLFKRTHGGPVFGSIESLQRWKQVGFVWNGVLEQVQDDADIFIFVESDLIWDAATMLALIDRLGDGVDAVMPMVFVNGSERYYDTSFTVKDGVRFRPWPPYHPAVNGELTRLDCAGSCVVMRAEIARACRFSDETCIAGFWEQAQAMGYGLWLSPAEKVWHPS